MRFNRIDEFEVCNGEGIGVSLFVQGCPFHCKGCFNSETWDFDGGKEWNDEVEKKFFELISKPYVKRVTILGGEPLCKENVDEVLQIVLLIRSVFGYEKSIWIYTGFKFEDFTQNQKVAIGLADFVVDGQYEEDKNDLSLPFRGSTNQRIIDVAKSFSEERVICKSD